MSEISAEARSKITPIEAYRLKMSGAKTAQETVEGYADDPRIKWIELNRTVSVPDPVETEESKRSNK